MIALGFSLLFLGFFLLVSIESSCYPPCDHGECIRTIENTPFVCVCQNGYLGAACNQLLSCNGIPIDDEEVCSGHGFCTAKIVEVGDYLHEEDPFFLANETVCSCDVNWSGDDCETGETARAVLQRLIDFFQNRSRTWIVLGIVFLVLLLTLVACLGLVGVGLFFLRRRWNSDDEDTPREVLINTFIGGFGEE